MEWGGCVLKEDDAVNRCFQLGVCGTKDLLVFRYQGGWCLLSSTTVNKNMKLDERKRMSDMVE